MRLRTFVGLVAMFTFAGSILTASSASAYPLTVPLGTSLTAPSATSEVPSVEGCPRQRSAR